MVNTPVSDADKFSVLTANGEDKWFANPKLSNYEEWIAGLTAAEKSIIYYYTGSGYDNLNDELYTTPWDLMYESDKLKAATLYEALNKFELHHGLTVMRQCDSRVFGVAPGASADKIVEQLKQSNGVVQANGFMSTGASGSGTSVDSSGVVLKIEVPPSKGAGAYIKSMGIGHEHEFLMNSNGVYKVDVNSVHKGSDGKVHATMRWIGQAKIQTIDPKNKSYKGKKGA